MFSILGHLPERIAITLYCAGVLLIPPAAAEELPYLSVAEAERIALDNEPGREQLRARAREMDGRSAIAESLPDPTLRVGMVNYPVSGGGFTTEGMTQLQVGYRQAFPRRALRRAEADRFSALANQHEVSSEVRTRDVVEAVRVAWLDVWYWERAAEVVESSRDYFADLVNVTTSLYSVGRKTQHDVLRSELELGRLEDRLIGIEQRRTEARGRLYAWVGDAAYRPLIATIPEWEQVPELDALRGTVIAHPQLTALDAAISAGDAAVRGAEQRARPGWALDLGYGHRGGTLTNGEPRSDFVSVNVVVDLPFFNKPRRNGELLAALGQRTAAQEQRRRAAVDLASELESEYSSWLNLTRRLALYETELIGMSEHQADAALLAYRNDVADFADVIRSYLELVETQLEHHRISTQRAQSFAALANLGGLTP